jgi:hypothetical protein
VYPPPRVSPTATIARGRGGFLSRARRAAPRRRRRARASRAQRMRAQVAPSFFSKKKGFSSSSVSNPT